MTRLVYTSQFKKDLNDIGLHIAQDNPQRAMNYVRELREQYRKITEAPKVYRPWPEFGTDTARQGGAGLHLPCFSGQEAP
jgi:toxin ParE1/3/4